MVEAGVIRDSKTCHFERSEKSAFIYVTEKQISHPMMPGSK